MDNIYSIQDETLTAIGEAIRQKGNTTELLTPLEMPQAIIDIPLGVVPPVGALHFTGNTKGLFANGKWDWFIEQLGDQITTENLLSIEEMFKLSTLKKISFAINRTNNDSNAGNNSCAYCFQQCYDLEELPDITGKLSNCYMFLSQCRSIREIPESWANIGWSYTNKQTSMSYCRLSSFFDRCFSLRKIPESVVKQMYNKCASNGCDGMFYYCTCLDEIVGLRGPDTSTGSNVFSSMFTNCFRLKRLVFDMDNGQPRVYDWSYQTLDLTNRVGYTETTYNRDNYILPYNSGITADKEVVDDATYQALKDDPDWFTWKIEYSRYNHDSAVETINSLPDCSQRGTTNNIKFKGASGSKTDGGAINTMTAEEIAVATAKGWTVSFS